MVSPRHSWLVLLDRGMLVGTILYEQQPGFRIYCTQPPGCLTVVTAAVAAVAGLWRWSLTLQVKLSSNQRRLLINALRASHDTRAGQETVTRIA